MVSKAKSEDKNTMLKIHTTSNVSFLCFVMHLFQHPDLRRHIIAIVISLVLACVLTWPIVIHPTTQLIGHPGNDTWNHVWGYWWVADSIEKGVWPQYAELMAWPNGGSLYFIDTMQAVFSWPMQKIFGPVFAYNFVIIVQLALCGYGAWLLAFKKTGDAFGSCAALFIFEMTPHIMGQAYNGISETVCAGWFPLSIWALFCLMERPSWKNASLLVLFGSLCILSSWYYGLFTAIAASILLLWSVLTQGWLYRWRHISIWLLVAAVLSLLIVAGPFLSFQSSLGAEDALVTRDPDFVERSLINHNITDIVAFFNPSKVPSPNLFLLYGEELIIVIYIGWIAISLAIYSIYSFRRTREIAPWIWMGLLFFLFSLGPYLNVGGSYLELDGKRIPLPFLALFTAFPIFDRISHPFRFTVGVELAVAILAAHGARKLLRGYETRSKIAILCALGFAIMMEYRLASPAQIPIPTSDATISQAYEDMKEDPIHGAVLDLPLTLPNLERAIFVWNQSVHERPVPWGLNDPMPTALLKNQLTKTLIEIEGNRSRSLPHILPELDLVISSRSLVRQGYRYIVVHKDFYPRYKVDQVEQILTALYGIPKIYQQDKLLVYPLALETANNE